MNIIQCPHCRVRLQTKTAKLAGREVPCPKCGQRFMVSVADEHAAAEPPSHVSSMAEPVVDAELVATEETGPHTSPPIAFPVSVEPFQQSARQPSSKRSTTVLVAVAVSAPILGFLSIWVILTSLSAIGRSDSRGGSESETVTSNDGVAQITLYGNLRQSPSLSQDEQIRARNPREQLHLLLVNDRKAIFVADMDLNRYSDERITAIRDEHKDFQVGPPQLRTISGFQAQEFEGNATLGEGRARCLLTTVETHDHFHTILMWSRPTEFEDHRPLMQRIASTFRLVGEHPGPSLAQASRPSAWIEFEAPDGLFRAQFPGQPKQEKHRKNRADFHYTDKDGVDYCVRVMPKPELANIPADRQKLVEMSLSAGIAMEYYEKELRRRPLELNGHPGAEIVLQIKDQNIVDVYRLFLVDTTVFLLWVNGRASADHPDTERFFDSFSPGAASVSQAELEEAARSSSIMLSHETSSLLN